MIKVKCTEKFRDKKGKIYGYRLIDLDGNIKDVRPENLKRAIKDELVEVTNLLLTSDNRLVDSSEKQLRSKSVQMILGDEPQRKDIFNNRDIKAVKAANDNIINEVSKHVDAAISFEDKNKRSALFDIDCISSYDIINEESAVVHVNSYDLSGVYIKNGNTVTYAVANSLRELAKTLEKAITIGYQAPENQIMFIGKNGTYTFENKDEFLKILNNKREAMNKKSKELLSVRDMYLLISK